MILPIALAKNKFIDCNENAQLNETSLDFLECLKRVFNFEERDLMEFDGNTCKLINSYDPTNSIFIYTNQQGKFLYTITEATPRIHKNNMIWDCFCYKMENFSKIDQVFGNGKVAESIVFKNIAPGGDFIPGEINTRKSIPEYAVEEKENFKPQEVIKIKASQSWWCFKLKFFVNPTTKTDLVSQEPDGSYNFFFPFHHIEQPATEEEEFPLFYDEYEIREKTTHELLSLQSIVSKYSSNLKSIELLPFFPYKNNVLGGSISIDTSAGSTWATIGDYTGGAKWTDAGIFFPYGHTNKRDNSNNLDIGFLESSGYSSLEDILLGGGARGKIITPLGNIPLNFNSFKNSMKKNTVSASFYLKSEGWKIDGLFECEVPPHYLNFYTDNAGQVFIQSQTTNALEMRELYRKFDLEKKSTYLNRGTSILSGIVGGALSGNLAGAVGGVLDNVIGGGSDILQARMDYNFAKESFEDKVKTQGLLASMTGKSITGNVQASDIVVNFSKDIFLIIIELNWSLWQKIFDGSLARMIIPQRDYDYSVQASQPQNMSGPQSKITVNRTGSYDYTKEYNCVAHFVRNLLGLHPGFANVKIINYFDHWGLNYNVTFKISNVPTGINPDNTTDTGDIQETEILNFAIRHKQRML